MSKIILKQGDCMELLKKVKDNSIRLLLTDIPYDDINRKDNGLRKLDKGIADIPTFNLELWLNTIYDKANIFAIFCSPPPSVAHL